MLAPSPLLLVLALGFAHPPDPKADAVKILPHWEQGQHVSYSWTKTTRKVEGEKETKRQEVRSTIDIEVDSADDKAIHLSWKKGARHFDDPKTDTNPIVRQYDALFENEVIQLDIDPSSGSVRSVLNWEEIRDRTKRGMDLLFQDREGADPKALANARTQVENMLRTREQVESLCTKNAQIYFFPFGRDYTPQKTNLYESAYPSPFAGEPILSKGTITLSEYDPETGRAVVKWGQASDPKSAQKAVEVFLKAVSKQTGRVPPQLEGLSLEISDRAEFDLNTKTGWIDKLSYTHSTRMGESLQEDTTTFTRQDKPQKRQ